MRRTYSILLPPLVVLLLAACGGSGSGGSDSSIVKVSWEANRESGVNSAGGGYKVFYSSDAGFEPDSARVKDVPYGSGPSAPTTATLHLVSGNWYIRVAAYSALTPLGSEPSAEITVAVP